MPPLRGCNFATEPRRPGTGFGLRRKTWPRSVVPEGTRSPSLAFPRTYVRGYLLTSLRDFHCAPESTSVCPLDKYEHCPLQARAVHAYTHEQCTVTARAVRTTSTSKTPLQALAVRP